MSPGLAGVAYKFTVKMKTRRILHEKTQRFLRGRLRRGCILIRNRNRVKVLHIERNKCRSFPPALPLHTYTRVFAHNMIADDVCSLLAVSTNHIF